MRVIVFVVCFIICTVGVADTTENKSQNEQLLEFSISKLNLESYISDIQEGKISSETLNVIYGILKNTNEVAIHQMRGKTDNQVFLGPDGHKEAVFDGAGQLVKDGINDGSYNYYHPYEEPLKHFSVDIHPWILFGNSKRDPTSIHERIYAYMGDIEGGIRRTHEENETKMVDPEGNEFALALLYAAIDKGKAQIIFKRMKQTKITDDEWLEFMKLLHEGYLKVYNLK